MRIFSAGIATETNTFSPIPVSYESFANTGIMRGNHLAEGPTFPNTITRALHERAATEKWTIIEGLIADTEPGGNVAQAAYESLRDELVEGLRQAMPVDAVLLNMHGAMIAYGYDDCEGDLLTHVRQLVGPEVVVGALFDPHAHLSPAMVENSDLMCFYKENPHIDIDARAADLVRLTALTLQKKVKPVISVYDCRMADVFQTNRNPMLSFLKKIRELEGRDGVLDISPVHGFRRGDTPYLGTKMVVITDNRPQEGQHLAEQLGRELFALRGSAKAPTYPLDEAITLALGSSKRPVVLADMADNPGGGAPGDSTYIVRALMDCGVDNFAAGAFCDPLAVQMAFEAGEGATLNMRIGGKACRFSGDPLDMDVTITAIRRDYRLKMENMEESMGDVVALRSGDCEFVLCTKRRQTYAPQIFLDLGVDLARKKFIIVKSAQHYRARFLPYIGEDFVVGEPGVCIENWTSLPFTKVRRDIWPFVDNPYEEIST